MPTRRAFLQAGGLALAGLALPRSPWFDERAGTIGDGGRSGATTIRMRSDARGARVWFDPLGVRIAPGDTVRWILESGVHSATAYHPSNGGYAARIPAGAPSWDSGLLIEPGQSYSVRLLVPGVYDYFCLPHELAGMAGRIVVAARDASPGDVTEPARAPDGLRSPSAPALAALPAVARILREGRVNR